VATWRLQTLGAATLQVGAKTLSPERKTAALLSYLALAGATPRSRLAGLLWPEASEAAARNNLSQTLRRLRQLTGEELIRGGSVLQLGDALEGDLLAHFDYDDLPEFAEWLWSERESLRALKQEALEALLTALEAQGRFTEALKYAERLVALDPASETAHRALMRLHYLAGDRPAALRAYERCKEVLAREFGVLPLPQTQELAETIGRGAVHRPAAGTPQAIPLQVMRPPVLVGRGDAWARMEQAWEAGQLVYLSGEPGVGKTRLALDFAASKGSLLKCEGRPGDAGVPYATLSRNLRYILAAPPGLNIEPWGRRELARILPELAQGGEVPSPLLSEADKLRFFEAASELFRLGGRGLAAGVADDLQFYDAASYEQARYMFGKFFPLGRPEGIPRFVLCYRQGELSPNVEARIRQLVEAELAVHIELPPLPSEAVDDLLAQLELPDTEALGEPLTRYTGGNPLFLLETLKHLIESEGLSRGLPERLPPPGKVGPLLARRLERLSPVALRVAQAAAVLRQDVDLGLIAQLLKVDPLELVAPWEELERAHILTSGRFTHDLLFEAVRRGLSKQVEVLLHRGAYDVLAASGAPHVALAYHAEASGRGALAFRHLLAAGDEAMNLFALRSAISHYERAHRLALHVAESDAGEGTHIAELRRLLYRLGFAYVYTNAFGEARRLYEEVLARARKGGQTELEWLALNHLAYLALHDGFDLPRAAAVGQEALSTAERAGDPRLLVEAHQELAGLYTLALAPEAALSHAERALTVARDLGDPDLTARSLTELELAAWKLGRWEEALDCLYEAREIYARLSDAAKEARALHSAGFDLIAVGRAGEGVEAALQALRLSRRAGDRQERLNAAGVAAIGLAELGRLDAALLYAQESAALAQELNVPVLSVLSLRRLGLVHLARLDLPAASAALLGAHALNEALPRRPRTGELAALLCTLHLLQGDLQAARPYALEAVAARDLLFAEPWIPRWSVVQALATTGDVAAAEALVRAHEAFAKTSPRHRLEHGRADAALAAAQGDAQRAISRLAAAAALAQDLGLMGARWQLDVALARLYEGCGDRSRALACHERATSSAQTLAGTIEDGARRDGFLAFVQRTAFA